MKGTNNVGFSDNSIKTLDIIPKEHLSLLHYEFNIQYCIV